MDAADYSRMLEDRTAGCFYWDRQADAVQWSPKLLAVLGYADQKASNLVQVEELIHPDDRVAHAETLSHAIESGCSYTVDLRLMNAEGAYQPFRVQGYWLTRDDDPARFLTGFLTEISEVARLRDQVTRIERLFQAFFDHAPAAVYMKDSSRTHIYGNAFAARIAGCTVEEFIGSTTADLFDEQTDRALIEVDRRILEDGETVVRHGEFETSSGEKHYVYDTTFPLEDPLTGDKLIGGFGLDTTRQHEAERALAQTQKMDALGKLVGGIAHDFNNTLAVLQGNLELVGGADTEAEIQECLSQLSKGVERGARLTKQLLAYARKSMLSTELANLNGVILEADRMLRRILPATITIETVSAGGLWNTRIDRSEVESAILNIALNARDAMPEGGKITIETSNVRLDDDYVIGRGEALAPGRFVLLAITDTGCGMPEEVVRRVFEPFFTTKPVGEGTGMGLAMVEGLMRQIHGTARVYSEVGVGTTIKLYFPASTEEVDTPERTTSKVSEGKEHILLAEDDNAVRNILSRQLTKLGYQVTEAANGDQALEILQANQQIQLLVTDIVMPGVVQGPELAKRVRQMRPELPVVFMSGYPLEASIHGNGLRPDDISLMKPVRARELAHAVRSALDTVAPQ